jgi:dihydroneopterin aldolase
MALERVEPQPFEVDVVLHADLSLADEGDELETTVDLFDKPTPNVRRALDERLAEVRALLA